MAGARGGTGAAFVLISGPSGIGKSTLATTARQRFQSAGAMVLEGWCSPGRPSYAPVLEVVRRALHVIDRSGGVAARDLRAWQDSLASLDGGLDPAATPPHRTPEAARIRLFDRLTGSLRLLSSQRPLAIVLHDLDLADSSTLDLVRFLGAMLTCEPGLDGDEPFHGLIMATASDPSPLLDAPGWAEQVRLERMDLAGLDAEAVGRYLASGDVIKKALAATGGNPRLLDALFRTAGERLVKGPRLGEMVQDDANAMQLMRLLAVAGRPLGGEELASLAALGRRELSAALARLVSAGLVHKSFDQGELRLSFVHSGDQSAAYQEIPDGERAALHLRLAAHLEVAGGEQELEARADHLLRAGAGEEAVSLCLEAGQRLEIALSFSRAAELYERALPLCPGRRQRVTLLQKMCDLLQMSGKLDAALDHASELSRLEPGDAGVALRVVNLLLLKSDHAAAEAALDELQEQHSKLPPLLGARALTARAEARFFAGDTAGALAAAREGMALCGPGEASSQRAALLNTMAKLHLDQGDEEAAGRCAAEALELSRASGRVAEELRALGLMGQLELRRGDHAASEEWYQQARSLAEAVGEHRLLGVFLQHLGVLAERRRDYAGALAHYQQAVGALKKVGHRAYLSWVATDLGKLYLDLGDVDRARAMLEMSARLGEGEPPVAARINMEMLRGRIAQQELRASEARRCYRRAAELASGAGQTDRKARALLSMASLEHQRGDDEAALALLASRDAIPAGGTPRVDALALTVQAELRLGQLDRAEAALAELVEQGEALRDREAAWQAPFLMAQIRAVQDRPAEHLRLARRAAKLERRTREELPEELAASLADHPLRAALRQTLAAAGDEAPGVVDGGDSRAPRARRRAEDGALSFGPIIGEHPKLLTVLGHVERVAPTDTTVLIRGESGTGKELIATAIHQRSARASQPMVAVNCGALVESLLLSDLFGHERGAFTGASQRRKGRFEAADGGTIFLDEIGDVSPRTQAALLRVLQEGEVTRVGGTSPLQVDVRIICATNRDLEGMVSRGEFREDLYYRLRGIQLHLPALRERVEDIPRLAGHFLAETSTGGLPAARQLTPEALDLLQRAPWQGNVRELKNVLRSAALLSDRTVLEPADFADYPELAALSAPAGAGGGDEAAAGGDAGGGAGFLQQVLGSGLSLREFKSRVEIECIQDALRETGGNITRAAKLLGIKRPRLSQIIKENGLNVS